DRAATGVLRIALQTHGRAGEAVGVRYRGSCAVALRVRADVRGAKYPSSDVFSRAQLVVGVVGFRKAFDPQLADVAVYAPSATEVVSRGEIEVVGPRRVRHHEVIAKRVRPLGRKKLPARADITLGVMDRPRVDLRAVRVSEERGLAAGVVVVDGADVDSEIAEGLLPAAI